VYFSQYILNRLSEQEKVAHRAEILIDV